MTDAAEGQARPAVGWHACAIALRLLRVSLLLALAYALFGCDDKPTPTSRSYWVRAASDNAPTVVVFIHGVLGDAVGTWTAPGVEGGWPGLMHRDSSMPAVDIFAVGYLSEPLSKASTIEEIANRTLVSLQDEGIFKRYENVVFVAHSMGGLVTKRLLKRLNDEAPSSYQKVKGVTFFSTPAKGSDLAGLAMWMSANPQFQDMSPSDLSSFLQALENDWVTLVVRNHTPEKPYPISSCAYETLPAKGQKIVVPRSMSEEGCNSAPVAFDRDHFGIVKPTDINDEVYKYLKARITEVLDPRLVPQKVTVKLVKTDGNLVREGDFLRSGEQYSIELSARHAAWFYVFGADGSDRVQRFFPATSTGDQRQAVKSVRIPAAAEKYLTLDKRVGMERIYIFATDHARPDLSMKGTPVAKGGANPKDEFAEEYKYLGVEGVRAAKPAKTGETSVPVFVRGAAMLLTFEHR